LLGLCIYIQSTSFILPLAKSLKFVKVSLNHPAVVLNSCSNVNWELQLAILRPWKILNTSKELREKLPGAPLWLTVAVDSSHLASEKH
jgi:hypothetical protein